MEQNTSLRRYDLDWLRVLVILNLVPFHAAWMMLYVEGFSQFNKNTILAKILSLYVEQIAPLHMPLLFLISGYCAAVSLQKRSIRDYVKERLQRLLVPFLSFMLVLAPIQAYFLPTYQGYRSLTDYWLNFCPYFFATIHNGSTSVGPKWGHLWFIAYLLVINGITLPLFAFLKNPRFQQHFRGVTELFSSRFGIFLPMLVFGGILATLGAVWPFWKGLNLYKDWAYFSYNLWAFVLGYMMHSDERIGDAVYQRPWLWTILAAFSIAMRVGVLMFFPNAYEANAYGYEQYLLFSALCGVHTWSSIAAILAFAHRFLTESNEFLTYMSQAGFPYYILHLLFMSILGRYITQIGLGGIAEFTTTIVLTFAITIFTYELLIRLWFIPNLLLGIKAQCNRADRT
ncbi:MAG: acyltransferase family protein [Okeania sp. SIO3B5]|uniref:acyltransferase family protein n=1 Tax=Okeania sp. SIO3B5 TaxID=2607811 RepID=UPI0013FFA2A9|nr:acyltransferase family protein [Okeania sp. SIO3B5]NEO52609.1 acyltransferase family protein [Okeania sp. SIO3B5]